MSEFTVPDDKCVEAAGRRNRVANIVDVCSLVIRTASTPRACAARADLAAAGIRSRPARTAMVTAGIDRPVRYDAVTAR